MPGEGRADGSCVFKAHLWRREACEAPARVPEGAVRQGWQHGGTSLVLLSVFLGWFLGKWIIPHSKYSLLDLIIFQK